MKISSNYFPSILREKNSHERFQKNDGARVNESLGIITECTGFRTNFKDYDFNLDAAMANIEYEAMELGLCYKLVNIDWCAQVHPDP